MATKTKTAPTKKKQERGRSDKVVTPICRVSFPYVMKSDSGREYSDDKYKMDMLLPKEHEEKLKPLKQAVLQAARAAWPKIKYADVETPFKDGDDKDMEEYHGHIFFTPKSQRKPNVIGPDREPLVDGEEVYGGCYVRASVTAFTYENSREVVIEKKDGSRKKVKEPVRGVTLSLENIQFIKDGERFGGGGGPAEDDFDAVDVGSLELGEGEDEDEIDEDEAFDDDDDTNM